MVPGAERVQMPKLPAEVTDTELAILDVMWTRGSTGVREIVEALYRDHTPARHATVKSLLERLDEKGYVSCDRSRYAHRFSARVARESYVGAQLQKLAESHFGGAWPPMLLALVERIKLRRQDREAIRKIIDAIGK
jgi:predicted transcriptional regulator